MLLPCWEKHNRSDESDNTRQLTLTARLYGEGAGVRLGGSLALPRGTSLGPPSTSSVTKNDNTHQLTLTARLRVGGLNAVDDTG